MRIQGYTIFAKYIHICIVYYAWCGLQYPMSSFHMLPVRDRNTKSNKMFLKFSQIMS